MKPIIKEDIKRAFQELGMENGRRVWKAYETLFVDGEDFVQIGEAFEKEHPVKKTLLGKAVLRLMKQRMLVDFAVEWMEKNR